MDEKENMKCGIHQLIEMRGPGGGRGSRGGGGGGVGGGGQYEVCQPSND